MGVKRNYLSSYQPINTKEIRKVVGCVAHKKVAQGIIEAAKKKGMII